MPLTRLPNGKLLYFVHVPKCAGTAVEKFLLARFGQLGMHDVYFASRTAMDAWSLTPPQHMPEAVRKTLLPDRLFDGIFATVRHPVDRLRSAFLFQREIAKAIPPKMAFGRWLAELPRLLATDPYAYHGHVRPMDDYVPPSATVFRVEDGMESLVDWLDGQAGNQDEPRAIKPANVLANRLPGDALPEVNLSLSVYNQIVELYRTDFERFGYPTDPSVMLKRKAGAGSEGTDAAVKKGGTPGD